MENLFKPPIILPGKASQNITKVVAASSAQDDIKPKIGKDYVDHFIKKEEELFIKKEEEFYSVRYLIYFLEISCSSMKMLPKRLFL